MNEPKGDLKKDTFLYKCGVALGKTAHYITGRSEFIIKEAEDVFDSLSDMLGLNPPPLKSKRGESSSTKLSNKQTTQSRELTEPQETDKKKEPLSTPKQKKKETPSSD